MDSAPRLFITALALALSVPSQGEEQINVNLSVTKSQAFERVMAALLDEKLQLQFADVPAGLIVTAPYQEWRPSDYLVTIRVVVLGRDPQSARVVLAASYDYVGHIPELSGLVASSSDGAPGRAWQRLRRIAAALSKTP